MIPQCSVASSNASCIQQITPTLAFEYKDLYYYCYYDYDYDYDHHYYHHNHHHHHH